MITQLRAIAIAALVVTLGCASAAGQSSGGDFALGRDVHATVTNSISVYEAWNSAPQSLIRNGDTVVRLNIMDAEAAPSEGGQQLLALVIVGQLGTGVEPVAFRITAPDTRPVDVVPKQGEANAFDLAVGDVRVDLVVQAGGHVVVAGHELGIIR